MQPTISRIHSYVAAVAAAAVLTGGLLAERQPAFEAPFGGFVTLVLLGVMAQVASSRMPRGGTASVAGIPFGAVMLLAPRAESALLLGVLAGLVPLMLRARADRVVFNIAQTTLSLNVAALAFLAVGGLPLGPLSPAALRGGLAASGLPWLVLLLSFFLVNSVLVSAALAIASGTSAFRTWKENTLLSLAHLVVSVPAACMMAWVAAAAGTAWVAALALPLLGLQRMHRQAYELQQVNEDLLTLTIKAIEARDPYTSGHSRRVSEMCGIIAAGMRLPERLVRQTTLAGLLHDVGKIHEAYAPILRKPGRLTDAEWDVMKTHAERGADLVATVAHLRHLAPVVRGHHESWDGTGYPDGLAGEQSPLGARIIAVADAIDALSTDRPYRARLGRADVRAELVRTRGTQFDPRVVDVVLSAPVWDRLFGEGGAADAAPGVLHLTRRPRPRVAGAAT